MVPLTVLGREGGDGGGKQIILSLMELMSSRRTGRIETINIIPT